jgi:hypothetical protein
MGLCDGGDVTNEASDSSAHAIQMKPSQSAVALRPQAALDCDSGKSSADLSDQGPSHSASPQQSVTCSEVVTETAVVNAHSLHKEIRKTNSMELSTTREIPSCLDTR